MPEALEVLAEVVELVDTVDSKSTGSNPLSVQVRPSVDFALEPRQALRGPTVRIKPGRGYNVDRRNSHFCNCS